MDLEYLSKVEGHVLWFHRDCSVLPGLLLHCLFVATSSSFMLSLHPVIVFEKKNQQQSRVTHCQPQNVIQVWEKVNKRHKPRQEYLPISANLDSEFTPRRFEVLHARSVQLLTHAYMDSRPPSPPKQDMKAKILTHWAPTYFACGTKTHEQKLCGCWSCENGI